MSEQLLLRSMWCGAYLGRQFAIHSTALVRTAEMYQLLFKLLFAMRYTLI